MQYFHDYTLRPAQGKGKNYSYRKQGFKTLDQEAVTTFRVMLGEHAEKQHWEAPIPVEGCEHIMLKFTGCGSRVALATFCVENLDSELPEFLWLPVTMNALLGGLPEDEEDEQVAMGQMGRMWLDTWGKHGVELPVPPHLRKPALATIILPGAELATKKDIQLIADMETCLAAAFLENLSSD